MGLQQIFIENLKKFRNERGLSQMRLAELCGTSTGYIGEIEIGRKFPSVEMVERIANALKVEPYLFFKEDRPLSVANKEVREFYTKLSPEERGDFTDLILFMVGRGIRKALNPDEPIESPS
jgi:transcriptional regulator with XRE-family HTH domain